MLTARIENYSLTPESQVPDSGSGACESGREHSTFIVATPRFRLMMQDKTGDFFGTPVVTCAG